MRIPFFLSLTPVEADLLLRVLRKAAQPVSEYGHDQRLSQSQLAEVDAIRILVDRLERGIVMAKVKEGRS